MPRSIWATCTGSPAIRRAAVAWRPSCSTATTISTAIRLATAPLCSRLLGRRFVTAESLRDRAPRPEPGRHLSGVSARYIDRHRHQGPRGSGTVSRSQLLLVRAWPWLLTFVVLGPLLGRGFVLTYDMVFVPDLAMRTDFLGLGSGLPRAVPSDAAVAVLDTVVPGD